MKHGKFFRFFIPFIAALLLIGICTNPEPKTTAMANNANINASEAGTLLEIHFIDVGQGDAILLKCGGQAMLIDAGGNDKGTLVQNYIQKQDIQKLDYVISTHPDSDHCGGLDVVLYKFDCGTIIMPEYTKATNTCRDVIDTLKAKGYSPTLPAAGTSYPFGGASFTILAPLQTADEANNNSVAIMLEHGEKRFLFTGDAEAEEENDIISSGLLADCDVYKAGHHGSRSSSSAALLDAVTPEYCVISCGENNSYGHPHAETLNNLRIRGIKVFRTDEQGSIVCTSDGKSLAWSCAPSESWLAGESTQSTVQGHDDVQEDGSAADLTAQEAQPEMQLPAAEGTGISGSYIYVCNKNTKKFHYLWCDSVEQMSSKNKLVTSMTRDEIISLGYSPCKKCSP